MMMVIKDTHRSSFELRARFVGLANSYFSCFMLLSAHEQTKSTYDLQPRW